MIPRDRYHGIQVRLISVVIPDVVGTLFHCGTKITLNIILSWLLPTVALSLVVLFRKGSL